MKVPKLSHEELKTRLHDLPGWAVRNGKLHREYKFGGFAEAFGFMSTCALVAQKQDHHPEWFNVFDRVVVDLSTDDAGGISALDFALAVAMDKAASPPGARHAMALRVQKRCGQPEAGGRSGASIAWSNPKRFCRSIGL